MPLRCRRVFAFFLVFSHVSPASSRERERHGIRRREREREERGPSRRRALDTRDRIRNGGHSFLRSLSPPPRVFDVRCRRRLYPGGSVWFVRACLCSWPIKRRAATSAPSSPFGYETSLLATGCIGCSAHDFSKGVAYVCRRGETLWENLGGGVSTQRSENIATLGNVLHAPVKVCVCARGRAWRHAHSE